MTSPSLPTRLEAILYLKGRPGSIGELAELAELTELAELAELAGLVRSQTGVD